MICKKCGTENEDWQSHCEKCKAYLKPIKFNSFTNIFILIGLLMEVGLTCLNVYGLTRNFDHLKMQSKIYSFIIIIMLTIAAISMIYFIIKKRKLGIIINIAASAIALFFVGFNSPIMMLFLLLPSLFVLLSILSKWSDMEY